MAGVDFTYTVGLDAKTDTLTKKVNAFRETLAGRPFDIKLDLKGFDTDKATQAFAQLGIEMDKIKTVTADVVTLVDKNGKIYQEAKGYTAQYTDELGRMTTAYMKVPTTIGDTAKKAKEYDAILKSTADTLNRTQNVNETHRQGIEKTADEIKDSISSWRQLAEQYGASSPQAKELETKITGLVGTLKQQEGATKTAANAMQNFATRMGNAIKQSFAYSIALRGIRMAQRQLNEAIRYTIDLDTEMTKIKVLQVEGAKTEEQIDRLAISFNKLAKEMGATTLEVAEGSVEWLRQGKTIEETQKLLQSTLMLSKLGNIETADATEKLTSTLNGYNIAASEATSVVDKLVAVDNVAATSVRELTTALQYSAAVANQTGVSFEQLVSYIGVVSETTRQNAESIGQGMKTMLTRMQDIKAGKIDEDGLGINNVEIALDKANIKLRSSASEFRDFGTVLEELAGKWDTLSGTEQAFISKSIAGVRQVNMFTVLMTEMNRALELQEVQMNSAGLAADRYKIHMESLEAKISSLKASAEKLYQQLISGDFIAGLLDSGKKILDYLGKADRLVSSIKILAIAFAAIKFSSFINGMVGSIAAMNASAIAAGTASKAMLGLGAAMTAAQPWLLLVAGIGAAISVLINLRSEASTTSEAVQNALDSISESSEKVFTFSESINSAKLLKLEYEKLTQKLENLNPTSSEYRETQEKLYDIESRLIEIFPAIDAHYNSEGKLVIENTGAIEKQIDVLQQKLDLEKQLIEITASKALFNYTSETEEGWGKVPDVENIINAYTEVMNLQASLMDLDAQGREGTADYIALQEDLVAAKSTLLTENLKISDLLKDASEEDASAYMNGFRQGILNEIPNMARTMGDTYNEIFGVVSNKVSAGGTNPLLDLLNESLNIFESQLITRANNLKQTAEEYRQAQIDLLTGASGATPGGYSDVQAENALIYGTSRSHELLENMVNTIIPDLKEGFSDVQNAMNSVAQGELIPQSEIDKLAEYGVKVLVAEDGTQELVELLPYLENETKNVIDAQSNQIDIMFDYIDNQYNMSDSTKEVVRNILEQLYAEEQLSNEHDELMSQTSELVSAMKEQGEQGYISKETALKIAQSNGELFRSLEEVEGGYRLTEDAIKTQTDALWGSFNSILADAEAGKYNATVKNIMKQASDAASAGNYLLAMSAIESSQAALEEAGIFQYLVDVLGQLANISFAMPTFQGIGGVSGGSGGTKKEDPRIKENEELIEQIEDQIELEEDKIDAYKEEIDLIKKAQDEYHDWIDQKKKSLELTKEESDYFKEQQKSLKELADIRKEIALLELDTSEEATAKRLELEAQAAEMEAEIAEEAEERRFDLQMEALDKLKDSFDKMIETQIEGIENVIKSIEDGIDILRDRIEDIRDLISDIRDEGRSGGSGGSGGRGGSGGYNPNPSNPAGSPQEGGYFIGPDGNTYYVNPHEGVLQEPFDPNGTHRNQNSRDYAMDIGSNVAAQDTGILKDAWVGSDYGETMVFVNPKTGVATQYYHLAPGTVAKYKDQVGKMEVDPGEFFAQTGNTGNVGDVAHLGVRLGLFDDKGMTLPGGKTIPGQGFYQDEATNKFYEELIKIIDEQGNIVSVFNGNVKSTSNAFEESSISIQNAAGEVDKSATAMANRFIDLGATTAEDMADIIQLTNDGYINWNDSVSNITSSLSDFGYSIGLTGVALANFIDYMRSLQNNDVDETTVIIPKGGRSGGRTGAGGFSRDANYETLFHSGGPVESHHDGNFAGNLQSNEVFAKLLKGEYVSTEGQMDNFLKNVLPKVTLGYQAITKNNQIPSITVNMPINVEGNMDKEVIPDIKKISNNVMEEINRSLILRGYVRPANNTLS